MLALGLELLAGPERALAQRPIGIDVSDYQSASINWSTLKNTYGISFGWAKMFGRDLRRRVWRGKFHDLRSQCEGRRGLDRRLSLRPL